MSTSASTLKGWLVKKKSKAPKSFTGSSFHLVPSSFGFGHGGGNRRWFEFRKLTKADIKLHLINQGTKVRADLISKAINTPSEAGSREDSGTDSGYDSEGNGRWALCYFEKIPLPAQVHIADHYSAPLKGFVLLRHVTAITDDGDRSFTITSTSRKPMELEAETREECVDWLKSLVLLCPYADTGSIVGAYVYLVTE